MVWQNLLVFIVTRFKSTTIRMEEEIYIYIYKYAFIYKYIYFTPQYVPPSYFFKVALQFERMTDNKWDLCLD